SSLNTLGLESQGKMTIILEMDLLGQGILTHQDKFRIKNFNPDAHVVTTLIMLGIKIKKENKENNMMPTLQIEKNVSN
ncbi:hypothetical protein ACJX0J_010355, partial [Zea mays]